MSKSVNWDIEKNCNLNCKHCRSGKQNRENDLIYENYIDILYKLKEWGFDKIVFSEKEPLLHPYIFDIVSICQKQGMYCSIVTNGTLLNIHKLKKLENLGLNELLISLEGWDEEDNDFIRGKGTFLKVKNVLDEIKNNNISIPTIIQLDITNYNFKKINEFINFFTNYPSVDIVCSIIAPIGNAEDNTDLVISAENYDRFKYNILDNIHRNKIKNSVYFSFGSPYSNIYYNLITLSNASVTFANCDLYHNGFCLQPNGDILKCSALIGTELENKIKNKIGNIYDINKIPHYKFNEKITYIDDGICKVCIFRRKCLLCYIMQKNCINTIYKKDCFLSLTKISLIIYKILKDEVVFKINDNVFIQNIKNKKKLLKRYTDDVVDIDIDNNILKKIEALINYDYSFFSCLKILNVSDIYILCLKDLLQIKDKGEVK